MEGGLKNMCINALRKSDEVVTEMAAFKKSIQELADVLRESGRKIKIVYRLKDRVIAVDDVPAEEFPFAIEGNKPNIDDDVYVRTYLIWSTEKIYSRKHHNLYQDVTRWSIQLLVEGHLDKEAQRLFFAYRKRSFDFTFEDLCQIYQQFPGFVQKISTDLIECYNKYNSEKSHGE